MFLSNLEIRKIIKLLYIWNCANTASNQPEQKHEGGYGGRIRPSQHKVVCVVPNQAEPVHNGKMPDFLFFFNFLA